MEKPVVWVGTLTQWLIARGEVVEGVPSTATARVGFENCHGGGRCKNDVIDAAAAASIAAYSTKAIRSHLRERGIKTTIPERADQQANRARLGSKGGRPPRSDPETYKQRNIVERCINKHKQFRAVATRYDCEDLPVPSPAGSDPRYD